MHRQILPANTGVTENRQKMCRHTHKHRLGLVKVLMRMMSKAAFLSPSHTEPFISSPLFCSASSPPLSILCYCNNPRLLSLTLSICPGGFHYCIIWNVMIMHLNTNKHWCLRDILDDHLIQFWIPVPSKYIYVALVNYSLQVVERQYN